MEPQMLGVVVDILIVLVVTPKYKAWWIALHLDPLHIDRLDNDGDGDREVVIQPSKVEDQMNVDNPIYDGPP